MRPPATRRLRLDGWQILLLAVLAIYTAIFTTMAFRLHAGMRTHRADLGQIAQAVWNSSRGRFVEQTDNGFIASRLTDHVEPILSLISPVLWLWRDVRALLLLQVLFAAAGGWLLYHLALRRFDRLLTPQERGQIWRLDPLRQSTRPLAFALVVAYLLNPPLQSALLTEFHAAPLAVPLIFWALWAVEARRWRHLAAAGLLVALVKEEMALLAALLGLWAIWQAWRQARTGEGPARPGVIAGAGVAILALTWFGVATFVIVPRYAAALYGVAESGYFARYGALGDSPLDIVRSLITQPGAVWTILMEPARRIYLWTLVAAFGLLPLLAPELLLLALPVLLANVLSAYPAQFYGEFHYSAPLVPYLATAAAFGLARLWGAIRRQTEHGSPAFQPLPAASAGRMAVAAFLQNPRTAWRPLLAGALLIWVVAWGGWESLHAGRGPGGGRFDPTPVTEHHRLLARFTAQLPADAPVTTTAAVHPHVALRRYVYQFPLGLEIPAGQRGEAATWALLDVTTNTDMAPGDLKARVDALLAGGWGVVDAADGFLLLRRGAPDAAIPESFYSFARAAQPAADARPAAVDWPRWRQTQLTLAWQQEGRAEPELSVLAPNGDAVATLATAAPPALIWLPAEHRQAGETYRLTTLPLWLPRSVAVRPGAGVPALALRRNAGDVLAAVPLETLQGNDYAQALARLSPGVQDGDTATFQPASSAPVRLTSWADTRTPWPGDTIDQWLRWEGERWPAGYVAFVHLRLNGATVAQQDGLPLLFGPIDAPALLARDGFVNDWRTLPLPRAAQPGEWTVVVGLYAPESGQRAPLASGGDELVVRRFRLTQAIPDQACALIAPSCAAQPQPFR